MLLNDEVKAEACGKTILFMIVSGRV
jgi:hypothetical protein